MNISLNLLKAEKCKRSFYYFIKEFWTEADTSNPVWNWHIEYLSNTIQEDVDLLLNNKPKKNDVIINCPPGTSKSMIISVLLPAWILAKKPSTRIISASYSNTIALELSQKSRNLMQGDKYKSYFNIKLKDDENTKSNYKTEQGGGRFVTSTGSNILGMHADIIICDDIQNLSTIYSDSERNNVNDWVSGTLSTRKADKENTLMIFVQQRLHQLDITSYLLSKGNNYKHIVLPGYLHNNIKPSTLSNYYKDNLLDIYRLNINALNILKNDLGSKNFNAQILQDPDNQSDSIIKREWIKIIDNQPLDKPEYEYFIDTAYGGDKSDFNAILECFKYNNCLYITNLIRNKQEFPELIKTIQSVVKSNRIYIEGKASGKSIIQQLKSSTNFNIIELQPKDDKITRLNAISPTIEGGRLFLIKSIWNDLLLSEVCSNSPKNDDIRDVVTYAVNEKLVKGHNYGKYNIL